MIAFYADEVELPSLRKRTIRRWIEEVASQYGKEVGDLCYQFCNDDRILQTNQDFLNHDYYTDIITFDESKGNVISGDMLISLDTVKSNARQYNHDYQEELHRVIIHGVLHLCGLDDTSDEEEERMRHAEDEALKLLRKDIGEDETLLDE
ncbi:rRNA maturation RNase YbeY [Porphyromonas pogonae]|uniref:rRNA maturation RNase YbeY n=1 Tax=Porphyromonas pogonae TaxID=867595 RepID=UPI002E7A9EF8|nr:rRNA maturation RNase YbeY [Porphyromonas pogonae]